MEGGEGWGGAGSVVKRAAIVSPSAHSSTLGERRPCVAAGCYQHCEWVSGRGEPGRGGRRRGRQRLCGGRRRSRSGFVHQRIVGRSGGCRRRSGVRGGRRRGSARLCAERPAPTAAAGAAASSGSCCDDVAFQAVLSVCKSCNPAHRATRLLQPPPRHVPATELQPVRPLLRQAAPGARRIDQS